MIAADTRPSLGRLTLVELRKMTDTRAGFWLMLSVVGLTLAAITILIAAGDEQDHTLRTMLEVAIAPASILLPIIGILLVSSEWSQRTAQLTFSLVPRRPRVVAAKALAGVALGLVALAICLPLALLGTAVASPSIDDAWSLPIGLLLQVAVLLISSMLGGIALGALLLASAPAIVAYFVLPIALGAIGTLSALRDVAPWLDPSRAFAPLSEHLMSGTEWGRLVTAFALWTIVPLAIGLWRIVRDEV